MTEAGKVRCLAFRIEAKKKTQIMMIYTGGKKDSASVLWKI